jgi:hypothetical protein
MAGGRVFHQLIESTNPSTDESEMNDMPIYTSRRMARSLWQEYRIYPDRLELQSWLLLHTLVIPTREIRSLEVRPSVFSGRKGFTWGIKIDHADLCRHVLLERTSGFMKRIAFSPDDPEKFVAVCQSILSKVQLK